MDKQNVVNKVVDEMKEEHERAFESKVRECLRSINLISKEIRNKEIELKSRRKELAEMEMDTFEIEI